MELPSEFSFNLNSKTFKVLFFATKHDYINQYAVAWNSNSVDGKINIAFYLVKDVEESINNGNWIIKDVFKNKE